ncbi:MAG TPA: SRPBCC family protein [Longimicrobiaceae bacterium]|jgi:uncharacterized protein YndB with AHSA1/START domain|nr:SRPBCC family protein [Longimicrobiaceae bacterium]
MATATDAATDTADRELVITRDFDAPRDRVFDAFTDAEAIGRWWGPRGFRTTTHEKDARPGGVWRFIMHGPDGTDYPNLIEYTEVVRPERLAYAHGTGEEDGRGFQVTVTFGEEGGKTRVTLRTIFPTPEARAAVMGYAVEGGNQTLERLSEYLAGVADIA